MLSIGIQPDLLLCRSDRALPHEMKAKIALFCNIPERSVITAQDVDTIYAVPLALADGRSRRTDPAPAENRRPAARYVALVELCSRICTTRKAKCASAWSANMWRSKMLTRALREALLHGAWAHRVRPVIEWIEAEDLDSPAVAARRLAHVDGILVPGGFGKRGIQGMINAIQYARERKVPFFGICLGMQCATIEYARNVAGLAEANSTEFDPQTPHRVIYKLRELLGVDEMGGTMRLGAWPCHLEAGSFAQKAYGTQDISERHRHRYEFNCDYEEKLVTAGLRITGRTPDGTYVEIVEAPNHPWFVGCQFHPEFKSKPLAPHPLFTAFAGAAYRHHRGADRSAAGRRSSRYGSHSRSRRPELIRRLCPKVARWDSSQFEEVQQPHEHQNDDDRHNPARIRVVLPQNLHPIALRPAL